MGNNLTSDEARRLLDQAAEKGIEALLIASNTVAVKAVEQAEELREDLTKMVKVVQKLYSVVAGGAVAGGKNGAQEKAPAEDEAPAQAAPSRPTASSGPRTTAGGDDMTPEQAALEEQMDAAIAATPPSEFKVSPRPGEK